MDASPTVVVRAATPSDEDRADEASRLIADAAARHDVARRDPELLRQKIRDGRAALALADDRLVGFGYYAEWEGGRFVSHSGLVVNEDWQGHGVGRQLKETLFEASRALFPAAVTLSLTTSPAVEALNLSLGFEHCSFDDMTHDPGFWDGCRTCRNYAQVRREGRRCCCFGMRRLPRAAAGTGDPPRREPPS